MKQRRREAVEQDRALCEDCAAEGIPYRLQAVELHHRIPRAIAPHLTYDPSNCEFLCKPHHSRRTVAEGRGFIGERIHKLPRNRRVVVCGPPGCGKTTFVQKHQRRGDLVWDADEVADRLGMGAYPRSSSDAASLMRLRDAFVADAQQHSGGVLMIARWPKTADALADQIEGVVVDLTS